MIYFGSRSRQLEGEYILAHKGKELDQYFGNSLWKRKCFVKGRDLPRLSALENQWVCLELVHVLLKLKYNLHKTNNGLAI
jgi:hypothetical protein